MSLVPLALLAPAAVVLAGVVVALIADAFASRSVALGALVASLVAAAVLGFVIEAGGSGSALFADSDGFVRLGALGYFLSAASVLAARRTLLARDRGAAMAALMALGAMLAQALVAASDLTVFFVSLVGLAVVAYALIAGAGTPRAEGSAMRYFVQGTVASGLTVFGIALVLGVGDGATAYVPGLAQLGADNVRPALLAMGLLFAALGFKVGAFPFHSWVPDAYHTADPPVAAYLGSVPKIAGVVALAALARGPLFGALGGGAVRGMLIVMAAASLLFGAFGMLRQRSVARMLGYSAIAQVGYALLALAGGSGGTGAAAIHIALYATGSCAAFAGIEAISRLRPAWDGSLEGLAGLSRRAPVVAGAMSIVMLSLTGIPLFAGFWGKFFAFGAAIDGGLLWPTVVAAIAAVVSFGGYGSVLRHLYFHAEDGDALDAGERQTGQGGMAAAVLVALAVLLLVGGVLPLADTGALHALLGL